MRFIKINCSEKAHKKTWSSTVAVPRFEAFALPFSIEQQR